MDNFWTEWNTCCSADLSPLFPLPWLLCACAPWIIAEGLGKETWWCPEKVVFQSTWLLKSSFVRVTLWWALYETQISSHSMLIHGDLSTSFLPRPHWCQFSNCVSSSQTISQVAHGLLAFRQNEWPGSVLTILPAGFSLHHSPAELSEMGL